MTSITEQLDIAEDLFKDTVALAWPMRKKWPIDKSKDKNNGRMWFFANDGRKLIAQVNDPKKIEEGFRNALLPMYSKFGWEQAFALYDILLKDKPSNDEKEQLMWHLARDNFVYLFLHEIFHDLEVPKGKNDEKKIDKAMYEGLKKVCSSNKIDLMRKIGNIRNMTYDFADDTPFYAFTQNIPSDSLERKIESVFDKRQYTLAKQVIKRLPDGVIPIWDILELSGVSPQSSSLTYPLSRTVYASMFVQDENLRKEVYSYFKRFTERSASGKFNLDVDDKVTEIFQSIVKEISEPELNASRLNKDRYLKASETIVKNIGDNAKYMPARNEILTTINTILHNDNLRYGLFKGFVQPFAPYISNQKEEGRPSEGGSGGNASDAMQNILDELQESGEGEEAAQLASQIANEIQQNGQSGMSPGGNKPGPGSSQQINQALGLQAADEYYRKNSKPLVLKSLHTKLESQSLGDQEIYVYKNTQILTPNDLGRFNMQAIRQFEQSTGLPMLYWDKDRNIAMLFEYDLVKIPVKSINYETSGIELPQIWFMLGDCSGSMAQGKNGTSNNYVGSENKFDIAKKIEYGIMNAMYPVQKKVKQKVAVGSTAFSNSTVYSGLFELDAIYSDPLSRFKQVQLLPQWGGTELSSSVLEMMEQDAIAYQHNNPVKDGRVVYTMVTDGDVGGNIQQNFDTIERIAKKNGRSFLFVGINGGGAFYSGISNLAKKYPNVQGRLVHDMASVEKVLGEVLIKYPGDAL